MGLMDKMRINTELILTKKVIAELRVNNGKAHELHAYGNELITIRRLMLEQIHWHRHRNLISH